MRYTIVDFKVSKGGGVMFVPETDQKGLSRIISSVANGELVRSRNPCAFRDDAGPCGECFNCHFQTSLIEFTVIGTTEDLDTKRLNKHGDLFFFSGGDCC